MNDLTARLSYFRRIVAENWACDGHEVPECEAHCYCDSRQKDLAAFDEVERLARLGAAVEAMPEDYALEHGCAGAWALLYNVPDCQASSDYSDDLNAVLAWRK